MAATTAVAADYPTKPVKLIVPAKAGGALDTVTRTVAAAMERKLGTPFPVVNVTGAASAIGTRQVTAAPADGYTLLVGHQQLLVIGASGLLGFDPMDKFSVVGQTGLMENYLVARKDAPFSNIAELKTYALAHPGKVTAGVNIAGMDHLLMMEYAKSLGVELKYINVPGGGAPKLKSLLGNFIDLGILGNGPMAGSYAAGEIKPIATLSPERSTAQPDIPSAGEQNFDGRFQLAFWWFVPKDTPDDVKKTLSDALSEVMTDKTVQQQLVDRGIDSPIFLDPGEAEQAIADQTALYKNSIALIKPAN
jgi:tripartite-type tricarboxylate transporter receptor subunit TctC